jgi:perosamine synthetase
MSHEHSSRETADTPGGQRCANLAVLGGAPALPRKAAERWRRPKQAEKDLLGAMLDRDELTGAGYGVGKMFEDQFAAHTGARHALTFSTGTAALMAAYYAAGVGPGDEVITPAIGYIGSYAGALHLGARPVFCDLSSTSLLIDPNEISRKISARTRAINIVHMNGRVCDLDAVSAICQERRLALIDDASHAAGAEWAGRRLGNFPHVTCFSLQGANPAGKPVAAGEGGVICTNDSESFRRMLAYCHLHRDQLSELLAGSPFSDLDKEVLGLKWRPHPLGLGLALISLASLDARNVARSLCHERTTETIRPFEFLSEPTLSARAKMGGFFGGIKLVYDPARLGGLPLATLCRCLVAEGIPARAGLGTLEHRRPLLARGFDLWGQGRGPLEGAWHGLERYRPVGEGDLPVADAINERVLTLPSFIEVEEAYYGGLREALEKVADQRRKLV